MSRTGELTAARREAAGQLAAAQVPSPERDAAELMAHVLGVSLGAVVLAESWTTKQRSAFEALVARRASREPLQYLLGSAAFRYVEVAVGPGVFVPRPETELLAGWAVDACAGREAPVVVDLCTGSGAIAKAIAHEVPGARVHAVELDPAAHAWAARNLTGTGVDLRLGDLAEAFEDLTGTVDVVVTNPPYIPTTALAQVAPEARDFDPHLALFSDHDGLTAIRAIERRAAVLLRPGGVLGVEHDDTHQTSVPALFEATGRWTQVHDHDDLAGLPRYMTTQLAG